MPRRTPRTERVRTDVAFHTGLERSYVQGYRISGFVLAAFSLALLPWRIQNAHAGASHAILVGEAATFVLISFSTGILAPRFPRLLGPVENWALLLVAIGLVNKASLLVFLRDPDQAANFMLIQVVAGFAFRSRLRFVLTQVLALLLWGPGTLLLVGRDPFLSWLYPMLAGLAMGIALHLFTRRVLRTLEVLRTRDQILLRQREHLIGELRSALDRVRVLRGLIPICAQCKKVRNDEGYWEQVESYLQEHSDAQFSHGLCPHCSGSLREEFETLLTEDRSEPGYEP